jgi:hypothetical protein
VSSLIGVVEVKNFGHKYYVFHDVFKHASRKAFVPGFFMPSYGMTWKLEPDRLSLSAAKFRMICGISVREIVP